jgi:hypothetical protein
MTSIQRLPYLCYLLVFSLFLIVFPGMSNLPQSSPLQRQIGRLRMARMANQSHTPAPTAARFVHVARER